MQFISTIFDFVMHLDVHLSNVISQYGALTYLILFIIIFCETGLVVTPFLPGDSLIFAAGTFAAMGHLNLALVIGILGAAAFLGDTVNYSIGKWIGKGIENKQNLKLIKREHLQKANDFFAKHGGKSIVIARFAPIVRTFVPFVAGAGKMHYNRFVAFNVIGGFLWVTAFALGGFFFGNLPFVRENFSMIMIAIILISMVPVVVTKIADMRKAKQEAK